MSRWFGVVWCGGVWCGVVWWRGVAWCGQCIAVPRNSCWALMTSMDDRAKGEFATEAVPLVMQLIIHFPAVRAA